MQLVVLNNPTLTTKKYSPMQKVVVTFDPKKDVTIIDCDVDIVTLGLAVNVLQARYREYLEQLEPSVAREIEETTRKAVASHAINRS